MLDGRTINQIIQRNLNDPQLGEIVEIAVNNATYVKRVLEDIEVKRKQFEEELKNLDFDLQRIRDHCMHVSTRVRIGWDSQDSYIECTVCGKTFEYTQENKLKFLYVDKTGKT